MRLFSNYDLQATLDNQFKGILPEVESIDDNRLLNTSIEDLVQYFEEKMKIEPIALTENGIYVTQSEVDIDVRGDYGRDIRNRSRPFYQKGTSNSFHIGFTGESDLFKGNPGYFNSLMPDAVIANSEIILTYETLKNDPNEIQTKFDRDLAPIRDFINRVESIVLSYNSKIKDQAKQFILQRREKILANLNLVSSLGYPMRRNSNAPKTYTVPIVKRKAEIRLPIASTEPFNPEPALENKVYEHILSVIDNMVLVMERSPKAFINMGEEDIRQHFLVQLNGQYDGQATGETFNFEGKTDILIRDKGKNIFIAECKFWKGSKGFIETIDQILGYTSWRDTKTAILVFNRNKDFTAVIEKARETLKEHPNYKRTIEYNREGGMRAVFHHRDDPGRELTMTVHLYEIPV